MNPRITPETLQTLVLVRAAIGRIIASVRSSLADTGDVFPIEEASVDHLTSAQQLRLDAFLKRFENLIEFGRRRVFRGALLLVGENSRRLSSDDVAYRLQALGLLESADQWLDACEVRNLSAHEYPENERQFVKGLNEARAAAEAALGQMEVFLERLDARHPELLCAEDQS